MANTIKVMIVDDEKLVRDLLRNCIDWECFNMEIIGEASNVDEALRLLESDTFEIVFTDIHMPVIDGMQFISIAAKKYPHIKFVVLTGYDYFDYAQKSVKLGVSDFLVKPIDDEEVLKTVSNLKSIIEQEREAQREHERLRKQLYDSLPYLKEQLLRELISRGVDKATIKEKLFFLGIQFKYKSFQVAALVINHSEKESEESRYIRNIKVINLTKLYLADNPHVYIFSDSINRIIILSNDENLDLFRECKLMKHYITKKLNCYVDIGIGSLKKEPQDICISYREALDALDYRVAIGKNTVILYDQINFSIQENKANLIELYNKLSIYLKSGLKNKAKEVIECILDNIDLKHTSAVQQIHVTALKILIICLGNTGLEAEDIYKSEIQTLNQIFTMETIPEIKEYLFRVVEKTTKEMGRQKTNNINILTDNVKEYVNKNYSDHDLTLSKVAKTFYVNPSYLSRIFKKETGVNFINYLKTIRMKKALSLISSKEDLKVFEIADAVGITDPNYFSTCFKKYTGMSVSNYKIRVLENFGA